jgi:hypothetical protein
MDLLQKIPKPTIERPFGIELWPIFDKAYEVVMGYPASEFRFVEGVTPMSTLRETSIMLVAYYVIIFGGREVMKNRPAFKLNALFMIHNFILTAVSAILLALFVEQLLPTLWNHGVFYAICDHDGGWTQPLIVLYYVSAPFLRYGATTRKLTLATAQLPEQVPRIPRHRFPVPQEEASDLPPHLPPRCHRSPVLYSADWFDCRLMGAYYHQPPRSRCHVLVLLPECSWYPRLVEGMDHSSSDHPVRH